MSSLVLFIFLTASPLLLLALLALALHAHKKTARPYTPVIGAFGFIEQNLDPEGAVIVNGELFRARLNPGAKIKGPARIRVIGAEDHLLIVEPAPNS
jgi:membrane-bound ClpP family serine protease